MGWHVVTEKRLNGGDASFPLLNTLSDGSLVIGFTVQGYFPSLGMLITGAVSLRGVTISLNGSVSPSFTLDSAIRRSDTTFSISTGPDRNFAFSWTDAVTGTNGPSDVIGQRFVGAGLPIDGLLRPTTAQLGAETQSSIALLSNRMSFMAWTEDSLTISDLSGTSIRGQLFTNAGLPSGLPFQINSTSKGDQIDANVTAFSGGRFLVTWGDVSTVRGQQYSTEQFAIGAVRVGSEMNLGADFAYAIERPGLGFTAIIDGTTDVELDFNLKGGLVATRLHTFGDFLSLGDGRRLEVGTIGADTVLRVLSDTGQFSGIEMLAGNSTLGSTLGRFLYAVPFGDGLVAIFRQTDLRVGILSTPVSEITTTVIDTKVYVGDTRAEVILGGSRNDVLDGAGGDDVMEGRDGNDVMTGGDGNDQMTGGAGIDNMNGGAGNDTIRASDAGDVLVGGGGNDVFLLSGSAVGTVSTTTGREIGAVSISQPTKVVGGAGADTVVIEGGTRLALKMTALIFEGVEGLRVAEGSLVGTTEIRLDTAQFGKGGLAGSFTLTGLDLAGATEMLRLSVSGGERFSMAGWSFADWGGQGERIVIEGGGAGDWIQASAWNDDLRGGGGADTLFGAGRDDRIFGGAGQDVLTGGFGADRLTGGAGADRFVLHTATESGIGRQADRITDFVSGEDMLDLSGLLLQGRFVGHHLFSNVAGEVRLQGNRLRGDVDGDGRVDWSVVLESTTGVGVDDLLFA